MEGKGIGTGDVPFPVPPGPYMPQIPLARSREQGHLRKITPVGHLGKRTLSQEGPCGEVLGCLSQL